MPMASAPGAPRPKDIIPIPKKRRCAGPLTWDRYQQIKETMTAGDRLIVERMFEELRKREAEKETK